MKRAVVVFLLFVLVSIIASCVALLFGNFSALAAGTPLHELHVSAEASGVSAFVMEFLLSVGLLWYFSWADKATDAAYANRVKVTAPKLGGCLLGQIVLVVGLSMFLAPFHLPDGGSTLLFEGMKHNVLCLLLLCVVGPVTEELVFRRGVLLGLLKNGIRPQWAVVASAVLFALVHGNLSQGIVALIVGLFFGQAFLHTGNLRLTVPLHIANNTLAVAFMYFPTLGAALESQSTAVSLIVGLVLVAAGATALLYCMKPKENSIPFC